jgi:hypothetical protein
MIEPHLLTSSEELPMAGPCNENAPDSTTENGPDVWNQEIDLDDMTGEIARTLLACEELTGTEVDPGVETTEEHSWGGVGWWFRAR